MTPKEEFDKIFTVGAAGFMHTFGCILAYGSAIVFMISWGWPAFALSLVMFVGFQLRARGWSRLLEHKDFIHSLRRKK